MKVRKDAAQYWELWEKYAARADTPVWTAGKFGVASLFTTRMMVQL